MTRPPKAGDLVAGRYQLIERVSPKLSPELSLAEVISERLKLIHEGRERLVEAWIAETGLKPSECMLVEQHRTDGSITLRVEKRDAMQPGDKAKRAVAAIVNDLSDRRGLCHAWDSIDEDVQDEIIKVWEAYVIEALG